MSPIPDLRDPARWSSWGEALNHTFAQARQSTRNVILSSRSIIQHCYSPLLPIYPSSFLHQKSLTIPLCQRDSPLKT
ncbi:hypothetical protein HBI23_176540 [Parastagonospora nodorum]|nr:hypothetical protein HBI72_140000 [Parastagonospora nodorum]KAH5316835.1 hypothetical protein HBI12_121330 [Parastagonospora nodorum]KAH5598508.1 hypothetical protein HBI45_161340 [Parastagonospora nodorum]KAH5648849.1 hypothetical protein HBI23_176540 [Parastagonospora nodorum]KAH5722776.1 hypothetical protein HBI20_090870 [Parastagonospora nodorum]